MSSSVAKEPSLFCHRQHRGHIRLLEDPDHYPRHGIVTLPWWTPMPGRPIVFVEDTAAQTSGCTTAGIPGVYRFPTSFDPSGTSVGKPTVGTAGCCRWRRRGAFSFPASSTISITRPGRDGRVPLCGGIDSTSGSLYRVPITSSGAMGTPVAVRSTVRPRIRRQSPSSATTAQARVSPAVQQGPQRHRLHLLQCLQCKRSRLCNHRGGRLHPGL